MKTHLALLRGINVSGHNMIKMDALKTVLENAGFTNVQTYIINRLHPMRDGRYCMLQSF